jgi:hypothetical protein
VNEPEKEECVELPLLVPGWQWVDLERAANAQGLTVGQLLRRLIEDHLAQRADNRWPVEPSRLPQRVQVVAGLHRTSKW